MIACSPFLYPQSTIAATTAVTGAAGVAVAAAASRWPEVFLGVFLGFPALALQEGGVAEGSIGVHEDLGKGMRVTG